MVSSSNRNIIGIIGGVGPYAGLDLNAKIFDQTIAVKDQDHLRIVLFSFSEDIPDRTLHIQGKTTEDIAGPTLRILAKMADLGISIVGIPCNTFHAPVIYDKVVESMARNNINIELVNMIEEVGSFVEAHYSNIKKIGVLGTTGTTASKIYNPALEKRGIEVVYPDAEMQSKLHSAIYHPAYGIKSQSDPVSEKAKTDILHAVHHMIVKDVQTLVLGCTELPLAVKITNINNVPVIDSTLILARALIRRVAPEKLKPFPFSSS
jgi:aspartate racemase